MAEPRLRDVLHELRRAALADAAGVSDRDLLDRFVSKRDEAAFELLVWRHQRFVLGVCRRVLQHTQDAEDAFQATFLTLARKAVSIRGQAIAAWLYQVAYHIALRLRVQHVRRDDAESKRCELTITSNPQVTEQWNDVRPILDEELGRLPDKYRVPIVLCYLEGKTYDEAARDLHVPKGTVSIRLTRARELLRDRLTRRGVTLSAATLGTVLAEQTIEASVPPVLVEAAFASALRNSATPAVQSLSHLATRAMMLQTLRSVGTAAAAVLILTVGLGWALHAAFAKSNAADDVQPLVRKQEPPKNEPKQEPGMDLFGDALPAGAAARLGTVRLRHGRLDYYYTYRENGLRIDCNTLNFSPDGKSVISTGGGWIRRWDVATGNATVNLGDGWRSLTLQGNSASSSGSVGVSADGKTARFVSRDSPGTFRGGWQCDEFDLETGMGRRAYRIASPRDHEEYGLVPAVWSPDGKTLVDFARNGGLTFWDASSGNLTRHIKPEDGIYSALVFAPDGKTVIVGNETQNIRVFDLASGKELRSFGLPGGKMISNMAVSPDAKWLVTASGTKTEPRARTVPEFDQFFRVWNLSEGTLVRTIPLPESENVGFPGLIFASDSRTLLASSGRRYSICSWDVTTGKPGRSWTGAPWIGGGPIAVSPDGKTLAAMKSTGVIQLWDMESGKEKQPLAGNSWGVMAVGFQYDGKTILTVGYDQAVRTWNATTGRLQTEDPFFLSGGGARFAASGRLLLTHSFKSGEVSKLQVYDTTLNKLVFESSGPQSGIASADGKLLATFGLGTDPNTNIVEIITGKVIHSLASPQKAEDVEVWLRTKPVGIGPESQSLIFKGDSIAIWDFRTGSYKKLWSLFANKVEERKAVGNVQAVVQLALSTAVSPDGKLIAFSVRRHFPSGPQSHLCRLMLFEIATGKLLHEADLGPDDYYQLAFSPDGKHLATAGDWFVRVWETVSFKEISQFEGHRGRITSLAFSPDGSRLASASEDSTVLIWNVAK